MNRLKAIFAALAAVSMVACTPTAGDLTSSPAPLTKTIIDEKALTLAAQTVDTLAISASALVKFGAIKAGSPTALSLATALDTARDGVNAAAAAREAGSTAEYNVAIAKALAAVGHARDALNTGD